MNLSGFRVARETWYNILSVPTSQGPKWGEESQMGSDSTKYKVSLSLSFSSP